MVACRIKAETFGQSPAVRTAGDFPRKFSTLMVAVDQQQSYKLLNVYAPLLLLKYEMYVHCVHMCRYYHDYGKCVELCACSCTGGGGFHDFQMYTICVCSYRGGGGCTFL